MADNCLLFIYFIEMSLQTCGSLPSHLTWVDNFSNYYHWMISAGDGKTMANYDEVHKFNKDICT